MPDLPSGTVTFLFTDIEGSTERWEQNRGAMATAVQRHLVRLRAAVETHGVVVFKVVGGAMQAAYPTAPEGVAAALDCQPSSEAAGLVLGREFYFDATTVEASVGSPFAIVLAAREFLLIGGGRLPNRQDCAVAAATRIDTMRCTQY